MKEFAEAAASLHSSVSVELGGALANLLQLVRRGAHAVARGGALIFETSDERADLSPASWRAWCSTRPESTTADDLSTRQAFVSANTFPCKPDRGWAQGRLERAGQERKVALQCETFRSSKAANELVCCSLLCNRRKQRANCRARRFSHSL